MAEEARRLPALSGREVVDLFAAVQGVKPRAERRRRVDEALALCGLSPDAAKRRIDGYSRGMTRRPPTPARIPATLGLMKIMALAILILASPARSGDWAESARPVYRGVEAVADGVYGLVRGHLISAVLPGRLSRRMSAVRSTMLNVARV